MGILYTKDRSSYRRWINVLPSLLVPGSAQFFSGRRRAGLLWMAAYYLLMLGITAAGLLPQTPFVLDSGSSLMYVRDVMALLALIDGLRLPIPVPGFQKGLMAWACLLFIALVPPLLARTFVVQSFHIPTDSMAPTLKGDGGAKDRSELPGDRILVNKLAYKLENPQRGDLIVFQSGEIPGLGYTPNTINIKRVVGLPGDTVSLRPPYVLVNGQALIEPPIFLEMAEGKQGFGGYVYLSRSRFLASSRDECVLKEDEYFVLADNSPNSSDSRSFGPVKRSAILGKAFYIYYPADRKGFIK